MHKRLSPHKHCRPFDIAVLSQFVTRRLLDGPHHTDRRLCCLLPYLAQWQQLGAVAPDDGFGASGCSTLPANGEEPQRVPSDPVTSPLYFDAQRNATASALDHSIDPIDIRVFISEKVTCSA